MSDKVGMLKNIMGKVDCLLIGGGMAATFLKAEGYNVGKSLIEEDRVSTAAGLIADASKNGVRLKLPIDVIVAAEIAEDASIETVPKEAIPDDKRIVDIGPQTIESFRQELQGSKTVFWNGPVGISEIPRFAVGTQAMAKILVEIGGATIIGGGSTAEVVDEMGLADRMTFVSTGGGASLKFLSGETLPGVEALLDKKQEMLT